jgi:hypothetical protein
VNMDDASADDIETMKRRVKEMEEEAAKIEATIGIERKASILSTDSSIVVNGADSDSRSIYVGNVRGVVVDCASNADVDRRGVIDGV